MIRKISIFLCIAILLISSNLSADKLKKINSAKQLVVGISPGYFPFEIKSPTGEYQGFDVDFIKIIAEELQVTLIIKEYLFDDLLPAVKKGEIDMAISAITVTKDRKESVAFSASYFKTGLTLLALKKNVNKLTVENINKNRSKIGVLKGSTGEDFAKLNLLNADIVYFDK